MTTSNPLLFPGFHMHVVEGSIKAVPGYGITELSVVVSNPSIEDIYMGSLFLVAHDYDLETNKEIELPFEQTYTCLVFSRYTLAKNVDPSFIKNHPETVFEFMGNSYVCYGDNIEPNIPRFVPKTIERKVVGDIRELMTYDADIRPTLFIELQEVLHEVQKCLAWNDYFNQTVSGVDFLAGLLMLSSGYKPSDEILNVVRPKTLND